MERMVKTVIYLVVLLLFQLAVSGPHAGYVGSAELHWKNSPSCKLVVSSPQNTYDYARAWIGKSENGKTHGICESESLSVKGNLLDLYYAGNFTSLHHDKIKLEVVGPDKVLDQVRPLTDEGNGWWRRSRISLASIPLGTPITIRFAASGTHISDFSIRNRADVYRQHLFIDSVRSMLHTPLGGLVVCLVVAASLLLHLLAQMRQPKLLGILVLFLASSLLVHFRGDAFFHADEWMFVQRLRDRGFAAVLLTHNEHFVPLFSLLYYGEYLLFGGRYEAFVAVSAILHALNGFLLAGLIRRVAGNRIYANSEWCIALFYIVNGCHGESIQWALSQCSLLATTFAILSFISLWDYLTTGLKRFAGAFVVSTVFACLSFGIGFVLFLEFPLLWCLHRAFGEKCIAGIPTRGAFVSLIAALIAVFSLYTTFREGYKHQDVNKTTLPPTDDIINFVALGAQFGTVLRGTGLFPYADVQRFYPFVPTKTLQGFAAYRKVLFRTGEIISLVFLLSYYFLGPVRDRLWRVALWVVGQCWIILPMLFIALGRAQLGDDYSISLRYQAFPFLGWVLLVTPFIAHLWSLAATRSGPLKRRTCGFLALTCLMAAQVHIGFQFEHFVESGRDMRDYVQQVRDWNGRDDMCPLLYSRYFLSMRASELPPDTIAKIVGLKD